MKNINLQNFTSKNYTANDRTPFTYIIRWVSTGYIYYGVKFAKHCLPSDLGKTYFSSSGKMRRLIKYHGVDSFQFEIRQIFHSIDLARKWETKILEKIVGQNKILNTSKNDGFCKIDNAGQKNPMFGLPGTMLGKNHSHESKQKISIATSGDRNGFFGKQHSSEFLQKRSIEQKGISKNSNNENPFFGKHHSIETKEQVSRTMKQKFDKKHLGIYHTPHGTFDVLRNSELKNLSYKTINNWCKQPKRIITQQMTIKSKYLKKNFVGKTFEEIGFWYESPEPNQNQIVSVDSGATVFSSTTTTAGATGAADSSEAA